MDRVRVEQTQASSRDMPELLQFNYFMSDNSEYTVIRPLSHHI